jgi:hypothetical protein
MFPERLEEGPDGGLHLYWRDGGPIGVGGHQAMGGEGKGEEELYTSLRARGSIRYG